MRRARERTQSPASTETTAAPSSFRRAARWSVLATVAAVIVVHAVDLRYRLVFDDYAWLQSPPTGVGDALRALLPTTTGAGVYRPFLVVWFGAMKAVFGIDPLPYHVFALAAIVAAALAVRWLALELGLGTLPAAIAGIVVGTHGALAITTMWVSCTQSSMMIALAAVAIAIVLRPGWRRQVLAAFVLVAAIMCRDSAVVTPVMAMVLLLAMPGRRLRPMSALTSTVGLWVVALAYGSLRIVDGLFDAAPHDPFRLTAGGNIASNAAQLMKYAARFGIPRSSGTLESIPMTGTVIVFWSVLVGGAIWAARRHAYLPAAGLVCFFVGIVPFVGLTGHAIEAYYIEVGVIGIAVAIGALLELTSPPTWALVAFAVVFVLVQVVAVQLVHTRHWIQPFIARTDVLEAEARRTPIHDGTLVVEEACASDRVVTHDGAFFRVLLDRPDLRVRFEVLEPGAEPTTRWGCREPSS